MRSLTAEVTQLATDGFAVLPGKHATATAAWSSAWSVMSQAACTDEVCSRIASALSEVGRFTVPPPHVRQRDFQALHVDFGVPLATSPAADVARYTALYVDPDLPASHAQTRIVPLHRLSTQREWPDPDDVMERVRSSGDADMSEGILGRLIEAIDETSELPPKDTDGFLCGMEFTTREHEERVFANHGLDLVGAETRVVVQPGHVMVFDNLRCAHGRLGQRHTAELHQLCVGFRHLPPAEQGACLAAFLHALTSPL